MLMHLWNINLRKETYKRKYKVSVNMLCIYMVFRLCAKRSNPQVSANLNKRNQALL